MISIIHMYQNTCYRYRAYANMKTINAIAIGIHSLCIDAMHNTYKGISFI